jgi:hypothetical protein
MKFNILVLPIIFTYAYDSQPKQAILCNNEAASPVELKINNLFWFTPSYFNE